MNINILGMSELKHTGMGEFNSDDHSIYYCGQESLRRNGVAIKANKSLKCSTCMQSQKQQNETCLFLSKPFSITVIQVYAPNSNTEEAEVEQCYEDVQDRLELIPPRCPFLYGGMECKVGSQEIPGVTGKFGHGVQNEARQKLTDFAKRMHWS